MCRQLILRAAGLALVASFALSPASHATEYIAGNPTCSQLDPAYYEIKIDGTPGTPFNMSVTQNGVTVTAISSSANGSLLDSWTSTVGIDAILIKAGSGAYLYRYSPEATSGGGLVSPSNASGSPAAISHISFCYDYEVAVSKTAATTFTREYSWSIAKTVTPQSMNRFAGESGNADYTVSADRSETDSAWAVSGTITISNPAPTSALITRVTDAMGDLAATVNCPVTLPYALASGASLNCTYSAALPDGSGRLNTATVATEVTANNKVRGNSGNAAVVFGEPTTVIGSASVSVNDLASDGFSQSWNMAGDASQSYSRSFSCPTDPALYQNGVHRYTVDNTATIAETGQSASASVAMNCYAPMVSKTANTSFNRYHVWNIDKAVDESELLLSIGQTYLLTYTVTLEVSSSDADFAVEGAIMVSNPRPDAAMTVNIADDLPGATSLTLACGGSLTVPAGGSASCEYQAAVGDSASRVNTATASLNSLMVSATAPVAFGDPDKIVDECVALEDSYADNGVFPATLCEEGKTYAYQRLAGPYAEAGSYELLNTACFTTNDTATKGCDDQVVKITVPPEGMGCTLTQGYWRTHSKYGPAPYDETWLMAGTEALGGLEDLPFFLSSQSYYQVLWTAPKGNAYYNLAHQWIAAYLNAFNGASVPADVLAAGMRGMELLNTYTPAQILALKGRNATVVRTEFIQLGGILDSYNNGLVGPGHCSEEAQAPLE